MTNSELKYIELELINQCIFQPCELELTRVITENESQEYFAHDFMLNKLKIKFRIAKITLKKGGQFVTLWQRNANGITEPFSLNSDFDFCIIATRKEANLGVFIFPKSVLHRNGVLSDKTREGKRAMRVYPSWDITTNRRAKTTQQWQSSCFIDLSDNNEIDLKKVNAILNRI